MRAVWQAVEKEERYARRQQRRAELEQKRREKSSVSENAMSTAILVNTSGMLIPCFLGHCHN